jgi:hypothetical protein
MHCFLSFDMIYDYFSNVWCHKDDILMGPIIVVVFILLLDY